MNIDWPMFRICHSSTVNDLYFPKSINFALLRHEHRFVCGELYNVFVRAGASFHFKAKLK